MTMLPTHCTLTSDVTGQAMLHLWLVPECISFYLLLIYTSEQPRQENTDMKPKLISMQKLSTDFLFIFFIFLLSVCCCSHKLGCHTGRWGEMWRGWAACFVYSGVTFFFFSSYFHTTSFIMLICEVERNAVGVERSGAPAAWKHTV